MSDLTILAASVKTALLEIARQSAALGTGLKNAAPNELAHTPNNSVLYLLQISEAIAKCAEECEQQFISAQEN